MLPSSAPDCARDDRPNERIVQKAALVRGSLGAALPALFALAALSGCAAYRPAPLTAASDVLAPPLLALLSARGCCRIPRSPRGSTSSCRVPTRRTSSPDSWAWTSGRCAGGASMPLRPQPRASRSGSISPGRSGRPPVRRGYSRRPYCGGRAAAWLRAGEFSLSGVTPWRPCRLLPSVGLC